jgi:small basic protein
MADNYGLTSQLTDWSSLALLAGDEATKKAPEPIVIKSGYNLKAGTPLGRLTSGGQHAPYKPYLSDGTQTLVGILAGDVDATLEDKPAIMYVMGNFSNAAVDAAITFAGVTGVDMMSLSGLDTNGIFNHGVITFTEEV